MRYTWEMPGLDEAVLLTAEGFRRPVTDALVEDVRVHLASAEFALSARDGGKLVCYMIFTVPVPDVLYIAGTLIHAPLQGTGIKTAGTVLAFERYPSLRWLSGRTQSSVVWASAARISSELTPDMGSRPLSAEGEARLDALVRALGMSGPAQQGFYGGPLYGEKPTHHDASVQAWWDTVCDFARGDAVLYLGRYQR